MSCNFHICRGEPVRVESVARGPCHIDQQEGHDGCHCLGGGCGGVGRWEDGRGCGWHCLSLEGAGVGSLMSRVELICWSWASNRCRTAGLYLYRSVLAG